MRSIERYLLSWVLGALALSAVLMGVVVYLVTLDELNEVYDANLHQTAQALGSHNASASELTAPLPPSGLKESDGDDAFEDAGIVTTLWTLQGRRVYTSDPHAALPFLARKGLTRATVGGEPWIIYTDVGRNGIAQAAQRVEARHRIAAEAASKILPALVLLMLAIAALVVFALRRGLRPLDEAANEIAARSARSLAPMAADETPAELSPLVRALNGLMQRLADALAAQRRFLGDAAHELRTPVTALRLQLQLLERAGDAQAKREAMRELNAGVQRSQQLVEKLLQVARADPDAEERRIDSVDLGELARQVVAAFSRKAESLGIDLGADAPAQPLLVQGEAEELLVLLNNLIENALRYAPAGSVVDVQAGWCEGRPLLRVTDNGPGIPAHELARVFDRFYRGSEAQALAREPGGSGLGLAIVRAIALRHGAGVSLHTPACGCGLEVRVVFGSQAAATTR